MRVSVLGTGDLTKIPRFTEISGESLKGIISYLGKLLAEKGHEMVIIPDRGLPLETAKIYKNSGGKKLLGFVPTNDKKFGIKHIEKNLSLLDERIEVDHWYDADGEIASSGDVCIVIGMSPGIMREVTALKFHYRYFNCKTRLIILRPSISEPIPKEIEEEIPITYIDSIEELGI